MPLFDLPLLWTHPQSRSDAESTRHPPPPLHPSLRPSSSWAPFTFRGEQTSFTSDIQASVVTELHSRISQHH